MTEKYRRINYGTWDLEITVDDPKAHTRPWTITLPQQIALNTDLMDTSAPKTKETGRIFVETFLQA